MDGRALEIVDLGRDFRSAFAIVDPAGPRAASEAWRAFLEHASKAVRFDAPTHPDNDIIGFEVARPLRAPDRMLVQLERRVGVETRDLEYLGTMVAICYLEMPRSGAASTLPDTLSITGYGGSSGSAAVQQFRSEVEASDAFRALMGGGTQNLVVSVSDL